MTKRVRDEVERLWRKIHFYIDAYMDVMDDSPALVAAHESCLSKELDALRSDLYDEQWK